MRHGGVETEQRRRIIGAGAASSPHGELLLDAFGVMTRKGRGIRSVEGKSEYIKQNP